MQSNVLKEYAVKFAEDEARKLHDEIEMLMGQAGIQGAADRNTLQLPTIYGLYDDLYKNGFNGVGNAPTP
jgi:hypothetical protein